MTDPRLRDVAERASVSMTTASIVLRRLPGARISPETRARVHRAADELGYRPRERNRQFRLAAVALDPDGSLEATRLLTAAVDEAWRANLLVVVIPARQDDSGAGSSLLHDAALQIDGLVHVDTTYGFEPPPHLRDRTVVVGLENPFEDQWGASTVVVPDDRGAAREVGKVLAAARHRYVSIVAAEGEAPTATTWQEGLADGLGRSPGAIEIIDPVVGVGRPESATPARPGADHAVTALVCMSARSAESAARLRSDRRGNLASDAVTLARGGPPPGNHVLGGAVTWLPLPMSQLAQVALSAALEDRGPLSRGATSEPAVVVVPFPLPSGLTVQGPADGAAPA